MPILDFGFWILDFGLRSLSSEAFPANACRIYALCTGLKPDNFLKAPLSEFQKIICTSRN